ncbi:MAG: hypothetical protein U1F61_21100 [Opitutaceae bacterium]
MRNLYFLLATFVSLNAQGPKSNTDWGIALAGPMKIAVPNGWRTFDGIQPTMPIYRQGDGMGVSDVDETGAPVQIGLTVEKFPSAKESVEELAEEIAMGASQNPDLQPVGGKKFESIERSGRSKATLVTSEFIKATSRRSFYMKFVTKSDNGEVWVATGYIVAGKDSSWPTAKSSLAYWLRAHVVSLTFADQEVDREALESAYVARDKNRDLLPNDLDAPSFDLTGQWSGEWQDGGSTEAFTMELRQTGATVNGTAIFMDTARTRAAISGEVTAAKIRLVMTPQQPSIPKTTWIGTFKNRVISGSWYLNLRGSTATGAWSAKAETNAASVSPKEVL